MLYVPLKQPKIYYVRLKIKDGDVAKNIETAEWGYRLISNVKNYDGKPWTKKQLERLKRRMYEEYVFDYEYGELDK
ncbi:hypothetical protein LCGC14_2074690 [marine sediment metagenome]|uniref:Uncharacterized protein n=1 Tax=marine sediment metagenome TaxID=412755 RepID=A0A0F9HEE9_9ZZZZ